MKKHEKKHEKSHGFTLVEMIVVLLIIAVLAAILIPALTGYIEKTKKEKILSEARNVWVSAQAALTECYGLHEESFSEEFNGKSSCRFSITVDGTKMTNLGRVSNASLRDLQNNPDSTIESGSSSRIIARQVLEYLSSADKNANPSYTFGSGGFLDGQKPSEYLRDNPKPTDVMIQIFHTNKGKVVALNFAKDGYMVTMVDGKETTCIYDGNSLKSEG